jgi:hypothetical protein
MRTRSIAAITLTTASAAVIVGASLWAWETSDYWDPVPAFPCIAAAGMLAGLASYARPGRRGWGRRLARATVIGLGVSFLTFVVTRFVSLRWTS